MVIQELEQKLADLLDQLHDVSVASWEYGRILEKVQAFTAALEILKG